MTQENNAAEEQSDNEEKNIPGEPKGEPEGFVDGKEIYVYGEDGAVPEHLYVLERPDDVATRMWAFESVDGFAMQLVAFVQHRYDQYNPRVPGSHEQCCYMSVYEMDEGEVEEPGRYESGLSGGDCPEEVKDIAAKWADAPVVFPDTDVGEVSGEREAPEA